MTTTSDPYLAAAAAEIEAHVAATGWDRPPALFALVRAGRFTADDADLARRRGIDAMPPEQLVPVEQDSLPENTLDEVLGHIEWPDGVAGCALSHEIVMMPPSAEGAGAENPPDAASVANHPEHREARLVVAVLRESSASAAVLRVRGVGTDADSDLVTGPDLAPDLTAALRLTFS